MVVSIGTRLSLQGGNTGGVQSGVDVGVIWLVGVIVVEGVIVVRLD